MQTKRLLDFVRKPHVLFVVFAILFGAIFIKITPPLWGLDEPSHVARVFHIVRGELVSSKQESDPANTMPDNFFELTQYRVKDILDVVKNDNILFRKDVTDPKAYDKITSEHFDKSEHFFPYVSNYSPVSYPGPIVGLEVSKLFNLDIGNTLTLMRCMSLISYVTLAAASIWLVKKFKIKWIFFVVALIPTAIFQASVVTADTMVLGLALLFFALLFRICLEEKIDRKLLVALAVVSVLIPLTKLNHVILILPLLFLPSTKFRSSKRALMYKILVVALGLVLALVWAHISNVTATPDISQRADQLAISPGGQIKYALGSPLSFGIAIIKSLVIFGDAYYQGIFFTVSGNSVATPLLMTIVLSFVIWLVAVQSRTELDKIKRMIVWCGLASIALVITIFGALYAGFTPVGWPFVDGVQGRYFLPLVIPIISLMAILMPIKITIKPKHRDIILVATSFMALAISALYVFVAYY